MNIPASRRQHGVALIEALVGILIFSIGILGLIGLQASMNRAQGAAKIRADAAFVASEVLGSMWADAPNITKYNTESGDCAGHARCAEWLTKVGSALPSGTAQLSTTASGTVSMTLTWSTPVEGTHSYVLATTIVH